MSYPLDAAAQDAALDAVLSRDVSAIPAVWEVALYDGDPRSGGAELGPDGGYGRALLSADLTDWPASSSGQKVSVAVSFGTSTDAYSTTATHYLLYDHADSTTRWFPGVLGEEVAVLAAGTVVEASLITYWNTES